MNKKKIIKIIIVVLLVILILFVGNIIRKMIIISDINNKVSKYINNNNHYEKIVTNYSDTETVTKYYCKGENAVIFITTTLKDTGEKRQLTQYCKGDKYNSYFDVGETKLAILDSNGVPSKVLIMEIDYNDSLWNLFYLALTTPITSVTYNEKECYFLNSPVTRQSYIDKETGLTLRAIDGQSQDSNGNKTDIIVEYEYSFDNVDDSIFIEPDISEYKIQENN